MLELPEVLEVTNMVKSPKSLEQRTGKTQLYLIKNLKIITSERVIAPPPPGRTQAWTMVSKTRPRWTRCLLGLAVDPSLVVTGLGTRLTNQPSPHILSSSQG